MCSHFSANQYEDAFNSKKLRNWTVPRRYKEHPSTLDGFTQIIATDRGHLLSQVPKSTESPWGTFMGTWDMPCKIPPVRPSYTARSQHAANNLRKEKAKSPLNNAVNGYKESQHAKKLQSSPIQRPSAPTPPMSDEKMKTIQPTARVPSGQDNRLSPTHKSTTPPRKSASPLRKSASPKPESRLSLAPSDHSLLRTPASG